jgi:hypothetical protein
VNWNFEINEESNGNDYEKTEQSSDKFAEHKNANKDKNPNVNVYDHRKGDLSKKKIQENFKNMFDEEA